MEALTGELTAEDTITAMRGLMAQVPVVELMDELLDIFERAGLAELKEQMTDYQAVDPKAEPEAGVAAIDVHRARAGEGGDHP